MSKGDSTLRVSEAKSAFGETVERALRGERLVLTKHGKPKVAMISIEDFELLEILEDLVDLKEAKRRLAKSGKSKPARQVFKDLDW